MKLQAQLTSTEVHISVGQRWGGREGASRSKNHPHTITLQLGFVGSYESEISLDAYSVPGTMLGVSHELYLTFPRGSSHKTTDFCNIVITGYVPLKKRRKFVNL